MVGLLAAPAYLEVLVQESAGLFNKRKLFWETFVVGNSIENADYCNQVRPRLYSPTYLEVLVQESASLHV